jgi:hypothetical protein
MFICSTFWEVKSNILKSAGHLAYDEGNKKEYQLMVEKPIRKQSFRRLRKWGRKLIHSYPFPTSGSLPQKLPCEN